MLWLANELAFLNTRAYLKDGLIGTDLHVKSTDMDQYLSMDSCQQHLCKITDLYSQALRRGQICSEERHIQKWTRELKNIY